MTPKEKYQDIDLSKLPEKAVEQLEKVKPFLFEAKYESEENKEVKAKGEQALEKLYTLISEKYPESIKSKQAKAPEPKTPQAIAKKVAKQSIKQPAKGKSTASAKPTKRGEISRLAKEIRKDGERFQDAMKRAGEMIQAEKKKAITNANKQYKKLAAFLKKNPIPAGSTTISRDAPRKALPAGKRTSKNGNTYYEYRQNRTDKHRKRYPYLALGGKLHGAGMFEGGGKYAKGGDIEGHRHTLHIDGQNWFLEKIDSTHFYMSNDRNHRGMAHHIGQHKGEPYYEEVKEWLKTTYAKGGVLKKKMTALWNEYQENEDENYHGENVVLLAKHFGTKEDLKEAKRILAEHEKQGYLTDKLRKERDELHHKLYTKFVKALKEEGVIMAKGGHMAKGGGIRDFEPKEFDKPRGKTIYYVEDEDDDGEDFVQGYDNYDEAKSAHSRSKLKGYQIRWHTELETKKPPYVYESGVVLSDGRLLVTRRRGVEVNEYAKGGYMAKGGGISDSDREKSIAELKRKIKHFREVEKSEPMARYYEEALFYMTEGKENDILKRGKYAKGGYITPDEYREKLENMTDEELIEEIRYEEGIDVDAEELENERETYISELVFKYRQVMGSRGYRYAKGGHMAKGGYIATGEDYEYTNYFGIEQDDFEQIVEIWHKWENTSEHSPNYDKVRDEYLSINNSMEAKYGAEKIYKIIDYIEQTHLAHREEEVKSDLIDEINDMNQQSFMKLCDDNGIMPNDWELFVNAMDYNNAEELLLAIRNNEYEVGELDTDEYAKGGELNNLMPHSKTHRTHEK